MNVVCNVHTYGAVVHYVVVVGVLPKSILKYSSHDSLTLHIQHATFSLNATVFWMKVFSNWLYEIVLGSSKEITYA